MQDTKKAGISIKPVKNAMVYTDEWMGYVQKYANEFGFRYNTRNTTKNQRFNLFLQYIVHRLAYTSKSIGLSPQEIFDIYLLWTLLKLLLR